MLKYLSWLVLLVAMTVSWRLTNREPAIGIDVHASLQREVSDIIRSYIKEKRPSVSEVRFHTLYTETLSPTKVRAVFKYSFSDELTDQEQSEQVFEGQAVLNKDSSKTTDNETVWSMDEMQTDNKSIVFKHGLEIKPGGGADAGGGASGNTNGNANGDTK